MAPGCWSAKAGVEVTPCFRRVFEDRRVTGCIHGNNFRPITLQPGTVPQPVLLSSQRGTSLKIREGTISGIPATFEIIGRVGKISNVGRISRAVDDRASGKF